MAWVTGGREVRLLMRSYDHRPPPPRQLVTQPLALEHLERVLRDRPQVDLPQHRGAGPCGSSVGGTTPSAWHWTVLAIIQIQGLWCHPDTPPFLASAWGPKDGPRGREAA